MLHGFQREMALRDQRTAPSEVLVRLKGPVCSLLRRIKAITFSVVGLHFFNICEPSEHTTVVAYRVEESRSQRQRTCFGLASQGRLP